MQALYFSALNTVICWRAYEKRRTLIFETKWFTFKYEHLTWSLYWKRNRIKPNYSIAQAFSHFFHIFIILFFYEDEAKLYSIQREQIDSSVSAVLLWKRQSLYDCKHQSACFHVWRNTACNEIFSYSQTGKGASNFLAILQSALLAFCGMIA